jgi:hypothetical protein
MNTEKKPPRVVYAITPERRDKEGQVVRKEGEGTWSEVGRAWVNADESISVLLDAVPVSGKLQIRDPRPRRETAAGGAS